MSVQAPFRTDEFCSWCVERPEDGPCEIHTNRDCVHVACVGTTCLYRPEPPTLGPHLPRQVRDAEGGLWTRYEGMAYYKRRDREDGSRYALTTWLELMRGSSLLRSSEFPFAAGPWTVSFAGDWH